VELLVVGAGYVGLTTAVGFAQLGHRVTVHDIDAGRVSELAAGRPPILEAGLEAALRDGLDANRLAFTTDPSPPAHVRVAFVCVPTPGAPNGLLDTAIVERVVARLVTELPDAVPIVVRSTLPLHGPDRLEAIGADHPASPIVVNPEFMREGRALADFAAPSRVAIGHLRATDQPAARLVAELYAPLDGIGLDPRIGRAFLDSGPGFGGSCLPEQAAAMAVEAAQRELDAPLLSAIWPSNERHQVELVATVGALLPNGLPGARVAVLGLAFKANTNDVRHSPALALVRELRAAGASVVGHDPVANAPARLADPELETADDAVAAARSADAVVVATEWPAFATLDWPALRAVMRGDLVYDTRRVLNRQRVESSGLRYRALGVPATRR
jgi:UDPglucose 6-dehydrogenase